MSGSNRTGQKPGLRVSRWVAVASLSLVTLFGCASIIGLDDYTVAGGGAAGSAGAPSGDAGEGGAPDQAGSAGASNGGRAGASTGGRAGASTGGGPVGEAGEAGAGPTPVPAIVGCDGVTEFQPVAEIVQSCILRAGCNPNFTPVRSISTCVTYDTQQALPGESCNLHSKTCADYEDCEHIGVAKDDLCGGTLKTRCQDNLAINCDNYQTDQFFDCNALGGTCATYTYSNNKVYADCKLDVAPDTCTGLSDDTLFYCHAAAGKDDLRYYCWENEAYGASCSSLAYCSGDATAGDATCYYNLPTCAGSSTTCKNNIANVCSTGSLFKYDCGAVGLTCGITSGTEYCFAPGCKAADVDTNCEESCSDDGSELTFCYGGAPFTVKCADYGFTQCEAGTDDNDVPFASCRF